jgi:aspartyl-tRNA(Asn)/glutamyl-tRNA(Gln) amidotransferase subunit B
MVQIKGYLNERALDINSFPLGPKKIADIIELIDSGKVSHSAASKTLFQNMLNEPETNAIDLAQKLNIMQQSDSGELQLFVKHAIDAYPEKVIEYKNGKTSLIGLFMGEVMKLSKGKADPKQASAMVKAELDNRN